MPGGEYRVYLVDKSALEQRRHHEDARNLLELLLGQGALATCHVIALEVLYSARNLADYETLRADIAVLPWLPVTARRHEPRARSAVRLRGTVASTACRSPT